MLVNASEGGLTVDSIVLFDQIRTVDKRRLVKRLGFMWAPIMKHVYRAIMISLGLIAL